jgi:hypothetical protein
MVELLGAHLFLCSPTIRRDCRRVARPTSWIHCACAKLVVQGPYWPWGGRPMAHGKAHTVKWPDGQPEGVCAWKYASIEARYASMTNDSHQGSRRLREGSRLDVNAAVFVFAMKEIIGMYNQIMSPR